MDKLYFLIQQSMLFIIPLLVVALGGMFSEKSGVINIALEGIMIIGAFCGVVFLKAMQDNNILQNNPQVLLILVTVVGALSGLVFSSLLAFAAINMKADQTIGGTALDLLAPALVIFAARTTQMVKTVPFNHSPFMISKVPILGDIPFIGPAFFQKSYITTYLTIVILFIVVIVLYKTTFGLRMSACGEHPQAAESVGVNVYKMRWSGVLISGALGGLGGVVYVVPNSVSFAGDVAGYGFLALAVMIFGQWKPWRIFMAAVFFGLFKAISVTYINFNFLSRIPNASYLFKMIPFIATMIALAFTSRKSRAPKAEGIPYDQGAR